MKLELSDKEVRGIGEGRWIRKHWKRWISINFGSLVAILAILAPLSILEVENREYIAYPLIFLWGVIYIISMAKTDKVGKKFLKEQQQ